MQRAPNLSLEELLAHAGWVRGLAAALVGDASAAEDLVQETWLAALRQPPSGDMSPRPWLARIVTNLARNRWRGDERRRVREIEAARAEAHPSADEPAAELEMHRALVDALMQIDEPLRGTILRRYFRGWSTAEIARAEAITENAVRHRLKRGLEMLRAKLDRKYGERNAWSALMLPLAGMRTISRATLPAASGVGLAGVILMSTTVKAVVVILVVGGAAFWLWKEREPGLSSAPVAAVAPAPSNIAPIESSTKAADTSATASASDRKQVVGADGGAVLEVLVINEKTRAPIPDAHLLVLYGDVNGRSERDNLPAEKRDLGLDRTTDAHGGAEFSVPPRKKLSIAVWHDSVVPDSTPDIPALEPGERRKLVVERKVGELVSFYGRVVATTDRQPMAGALASVESVPRKSIESLRTRQHASNSIASEPTQKQPEPPRTDAQKRMGIWTRSYDERMSGVGPDEIGSARSDAQGNFEIKMWSWKERNVHLRISAPGYVPALVSLGLPTTASEPFEIVLDRSAAIEARVVDANDAPLAGAWIDLSAPWNSWLQPRDDRRPHNYSMPHPEWSAKTGPDGTCTLEGLCPSVPLHGRVSRDGWAAVTPIEKFTLEPGERRKLRWKLVGGCTLSGRVSKEDGSPAAGVQLWLKRTIGAEPDPYQAGEQSSVNGMAVSDEAGHYHIDAVGPGRWRLGPAATRFIGDAPVPGALAPFTDVVNVPKDAATVVHDLVVHPALYIYGNVVDPTGRPVDTEATRLNPSVTVAMPNWHMVGWNNAGPGGAFIAGPLTAGKYLLSASCSSNYAASELVVAEAGQKNVVLTLQENSILSGAVVDASTGARTAARVVARRDCEDWDLLTTDRDDDPSAFRFDLLRPGRYELVARTEDGRIGVATGIVVRSGETTEGANVSVSTGGKLRLRYEGAEFDVHYRLWMGPTVLASSYLSRNVDKIEPVPLGQITVELTYRESGRTIKRDADFFEPEEKMIVFKDDD